MNRLYDNETDPGTYTRHVADDTSSDREISLGMPTILGLFFALALVCAVFFGFGYTMGRHSTQSSGVVFDNSTAPGSGAAKPDAGSPAASQSTDSTTDSTSAPAAPAPANSAVVPLNKPQPAAATPQPAAAPAPAPAHVQPAAVQAPPPAPQPATANSQPATSFWVQVAAVSSQDVANIETNALKKDGYTVVVRHEPTDALLHIQIGPFTNRKDADAMRQKVLADGFNAIVK